MKWLCRRASLASTLLIFTFWPGFASAEINKLCIFGDSLSDTGNVFEVIHDVSTRPYELIPSAPYPMGGPTFSNGRIWVQHLAKMLRRQNDAKPAFRGAARFCNYSFGGARAGGGRNGPLFDFPAMVDRYLADVDHAADPDTLYIIEVGGNDIRDALAALPADPSLILTPAVGAVAQAIGDLVAAGATKFLVINAPDVGLVPAVPDFAKGFATGLTMAYNTGLATAVDGLALAFPALEFMSFDLFAFTQEAVMFPPAGVTNTTDSCITPGVRKDAICKDRNAYFFWDGIHPTKVIHAALADAVFVAVPALAAYGSVTVAQRN